MSACDLLASDAGWLCDIEVALGRVKGVSDLLGRLGGEDLGLLQCSLEGDHCQIEERLAWGLEGLRAEQQAHKAALAAAEAKRAAPGSVADLEKAQSLWACLRATAMVVLDECEKAEVPR